MNDLLGLSKKDLNNLRIIDWGYSTKLESLSFDKFKAWVDQGYADSLKYLTDHRADKRESLKKYYPNAQSALCFLFDYTSSAKRNLSTKGSVASFVTGFDGEDYHHYIARRLNEIGEYLMSEGYCSQYKLSLDIHPVLERDIAYRCGLGWFGKNSMHISQKYGSFHLIGSIILNEKLELNEKDVVSDHCGNCTACIDACPTDAIFQDTRTLDVKKCISTFTIETFKDVPAPKGYPTETNELFGCDICQEVCPWNKKPIKSALSRERVWIDDFFTRDEGRIYAEIKQMSNSEYKNKFRGTSFERLGKKGLLKNLKYYVK